MKTMMKKEEGWKLLVADEIRLIENTIEDDLCQIEAEVDSQLIAILRHILVDGGKKIRPLLVVLAARVCGNRDDEVYRLAAAFEYLHVATLIHDDVIDNAEFRRGKESVVQKFGLIGAILAGDFLHAYSINRVGAIAGSRGLEVFTGATCGMVDGEFVQLRNCNKFDLTEERYYEAITGKTVRLISAACEIGAIFGGGSRDEYEKLKSYGEKLGAAFQIIDDLLDYLGNSSMTGKGLGNDLIEGKITLPLILSLKYMENGEEKEQFLKMLNDKDEIEKNFQKIVELIEKNMGFSLSREKAEEMIEGAKQDISFFEENSEEAVSVFSGLAEYVLERKK